ncbi:MAG: hypothetical protein V1765_00050 [bacterium]
MLKLRKIGQQMITVDHNLSMAEIIIKYYFKNISQAERLIQQFPVETLGAGLKEWDIELFMANIAVSGIQTVEELSSRQYRPIYFNEASSLAVVMPHFTDSLQLIPLLTRREVAPDKFEVLTIKKVGLYLDTGKRWYHTKLVSRDKLIIPAIKITEK